MERAEPFSVMLTPPLLSAFATVGRIQRFATSERRCVGASDTRRGGNTT